MVKPNTPYTTYIETQKGANEERETTYTTYTTYADASNEWEPTT